MLSAAASTWPVLALHHSTQPHAMKDLQPVIGGDSTLKNVTHAHAYAHMKFGYRASLTNESLGHPRPNIAAHPENTVFARQDWAYLSFAGQALGLGVSWLLLTFFGSSSYSEHKACIQPANKEIEHPKEFVKVEYNELISMLGIPAFCILPFNQVGISGLPLRLSVIMLALQSFILQALILHFLMRGIWEAKDTPSLPSLAVGTAIYLNWLGHLSELPIGLALLKYVYQFQETLMDRVIAYTIYISSMILIPCASIMIASMYLAESPNFIDLITKSIVFKLVSMVDTWIVAVNSRANKLAGSVEPLVVLLPIDQKFAKVLNWVVCIVPLLPIAFVSLIVYLMNITIGNWTGDVA